MCRSLTARANYWQKFSSACPNRWDRLLHCIMSAFGTKRTSQRCSAMSAFGGKTDIARTRLDVRFYPKRTYTAPVCCDATKPPHLINDVVDCFSAQGKAP